MNAPIQTTFANGINPFTGLCNLPTRPDPIMQKPAKPAKSKTKPKDEDYSTPYQPPVPTVKESLTVASSQPADPVPVDPIDLGLSITSDPLPASRAAPPYKYHPIFERMALGQALRVPTANVGKVSGAMRKWIGMEGVQAHTKSTRHYVNPVSKATDTGYGRVWLLARVSQVPKRKKAV